MLLMLFQSDLWLYRSTASNVRGMHVGVRVAQTLTGKEGPDNVLDVQPAHLHTHQQTSQHMPATCGATEATWGCCWGKNILSVCVLATSVLVVLLWCCEHR